MDPTNPRILLFVEADKPLARTLQTGLEQAGFRVILSERYSEVLNWIFDYRDYPPDALVLDLPHTDLTSPPQALDLYRVVRQGISLASRGKRFPGWGSQLPAVVLIPEQNRIQTEKSLVLDYSVQGQFVQKPFTPDILAWHLRGLLNSSAPLAESSREQIVLDSLIIDLARKRVLADGVEIRLAETEFQVLAYLAANPNEVVSRYTLLAEIWRKPHPIGNEKRYPDEYIKRIKQKLAPTSCAQMIDTKYGEGYILRTTRRFVEADTNNATQPVLGNPYHAARQAFLVLVNGGDNQAHLQTTSAEFRLRDSGPQGMKIGRDGKQVDIVIDDNDERFRRVSRVHAMISEREGEYFIRDANSSGGTSIVRRSADGIQERIRVTADFEIALKNFDQIHFNVVVYRFEFRLQ